MDHPIAIGSLSAASLACILSTIGIDATSILLILLSLFLTFYTYILLSRLYLSPISHIPGPRLAAATFWYEFYYDIWPNSHQYIWKIRDLHTKYGPVVRINPIHVHISDPAFYEEIHPSDPRRKRNRDPWFSHYDKDTVLAGAILNSMEHDLHARRRKAVAAYFSKKSVRDVEPLVQKKIAKLVARFEQAHVQDQIVNLIDAMSGLTMDIISSYCFGTDTRQLDLPSYAQSDVARMVLGVKIRALGRHFPYILNTAMKLNPYIVRFLNSLSYKVVDEEQQLITRVQHVLDNPEEKSEEGHRAIFAMMDKSNLPAGECTARRFAADAGAFIGAGTETTGRTLAVTVFHVLAKPTILATLRAELRTVMPHPDSPITLPQLEKLPYLTAILHEGLRLAHGVSGRMPRIATQEVLHCQGVKIPAGTVVMSSVYLLNMNEDIFPEAESFEPARWMNNSGLRRHLYAFGAGATMCLGMNLAWSELYLTLATLFRRFELELHSTTYARDVKVIGDCAIALMNSTSKGIRVKITGIVKY
nr:hypothetical protein B0A51_07518 [Rachicladosporium sp. CCFEE 5018]